MLWAESLGSGISGSAIELKRCHDFCRKDFGFFSSGIPAEVVDYVPGPHGEIPRRELHWMEAILLHLISPEGLYRLVRDLMHPQYVRGRKESLYLPS